jgi:asparagine synthase (glutamine-hydrolysing)
MCGIAGKVSLRSGGAIDRALLKRMTDVIAYRGPDGEGHYFGDGVGLGHRRLSIIDLAAGAQPLSNETESVWIVFNGEIYNYLDLRKDLVGRGHVFKTHSDTEVIVHAYEEYGPECVNHFRGMFAFAIWDTEKKRLLLARDRVGIKPLYYYQGNGALIFGSEIKSILADPSVPRDINSNAVRKFLSFFYLPGEETLLKGVQKLPPGSFLLANSDGITIRPYWDLKFSDDRWNMPFEAAVEELHDLVRTTVRDHMIADVPVGVLLSGGMDSSAICSLAVQQTSRPLHTFTIGFEGSGVVDERHYARLAAERFGTKHHELTFSASDFANFLPAYVRHMEEPVCEPPAVALYYISKLASQHVKVLLSGEGGDEAFAGYPNYPNMLGVKRLQQRLGSLTEPAAQLASLLGRAINHGGLRRYGHALNHSVSDHYFSRTSTPLSFFNRQAQRFLNPDFLASTSSYDSSEIISRLLAAVKKQPLLNQLLYIDSKTWLPDDLLIKADKITMANSVELRVPLLDHVLLEFAASLPPEFKVTNKNQTKRILKSAFAKTLPAEILQRKKAGFPVPYENWLRQQLKSSLEETLTSQNSFIKDFLNPTELRRLLNENARRSLYPKEIFSLYVLEMWHQSFCIPS